MKPAAHAQQWTEKEILKTLATHRQELRKMGVRKLGLFGSYLRGTAKADSDMDFLVVLERPSFDDYMDIKFFLEDLFHNQVDLVIEENLKVGLRPYILSEVKYVTEL
jgi:predicted nucleotidyltransferase